MSVGLSLEKLPFELSLENFYSIAAGSNHNTVGVDHREGHNISSLFYRCLGYWCDLSCPYT